VSSAVRSAGRRPAGQDPDGDQDPAGDGAAGVATALPSSGPRRLLALLDKPLTSYYLILGCTLLLLAIGLFMVQSTTSAADLYGGGTHPYADFQKQLIGAFGGLLLMWVAARASPKVLRALAYPLLIVSVLGLMAVLVPGIGVATDGARRWMSIGGLTLQPSEFAKLGLVLWGADLLARKEQLRQLTDARQLLIPLLPGAATVCLLVMLGKDIGTTFILLVIFLALLWIIGTPGRLLAGMIGLMTFVLLVLATALPYARERLTGFLAATPACAQEACFQLTQGKYALGSGGWLGAGLTGLSGKWGWVPNATTDWIFAILGEELGLVGTLCVVLLYAMLAYAGFRVAVRSTDTFARLAAGAITIWISVQALVNIGAVLGLLPITGVPLPLISAGVSSLLVTLACMGVLMALARREPGAQAALTAGPGGLRRVASWLGMPRRQD
jgi:cell division protein FtsW